MQVRGYDVTYPRLLLVALVAVLGVAAVVGLSTSSTAFGSYNPGWDGTSELRTLAANTDANTELAASTTTYTTVPASETTAFILSPTDAYSDQAGSRVATFLDRGGTVVVASDFNAHDTSLLAHLGVTARIDGSLVRDERQYYRSPALPVATNVADTALTTNVSQLTLNHASVVEPGPNSTVLVNTSGFAYLDTNRNQTLDASETLRERPVVVQEPVGDGRVIVVSDPSLFINSMLAQPDNRQFATNLVTPAETVVFDYSHRGGVPWAVGVVDAIADTPLYQLLVAGLVTGLCLLAYRGTTVPLDRLRRGRTPGQPADTGFSHAEVVERVTARHPEWDAARVERVARGITADASNTGNDD